MKLNKLLFLVVLQFQAAVFAQDDDLSLDERQRVELLEEVSRANAEVNPDATIDWINGLEGDDRMIALVSTIDAIEPSETLEFVESGDLTANEVAVSLVRKWSYSDPRAAGEWLATLPESDKRVRAITELASSWARLDLDSSVDWASKLKVEREKNEALLAIADDMRVHRKHPSKALGAAILVSDEERRERTLMRLLRVWYRSDSQAAEAALATHANLLTEKARMHVREIFDRIESSLGDIQPHNN